MKQIKIDSFNIDRSLGYLIQNTTKDSTQEILGYFYGVAKFVVDNISAKSSATWLDKHIVLFYKETPISYRIRIRGSGPGSHRDDPEVSIDVTYPKDTDEFDVTDLMNAIVETGLQLADEENMPRFTQPTLKTPACLRKVRIAQQLEHERKNDVKS